MSVRGGVLNFDPLRASATRLAAALRQGDLTAPDLVDAHIERVNQVNPLLNAMVVDRFQAARAQAQVAQRRLDGKTGQGQDDLPPFLGVPCTIKEFFAVKGMPQTGGVLALKDHIADQDAPVVARLKAAGFIPLGVSNAPEGGLWMETTNLVYGRTNNPWDLSRTSGGSSGGEAALVAAGASPVGLGSDIGGSIRIPAAMCGVVGHKPGSGLVPNTGQFPGIMDGTNAFLSTGPLVRRVEDLWPLLKILAGPDGVDIHCKDATLIDPATVDLSALDVIPLPTNGRVPVDDCMRIAVQQAAAALQDRGARLRELRLDRLRHGVEIWSAMLAEASSKPYSEILGQGHKISVIAELLRSAMGRPRHSLDALIVTAGAALTDLAPGLRRRFLLEGQALRDQLDQLLAGNVVLLHPPYSRPAPKHRGAWTTPFHFGYTAIFNVMQCAVTVVPTGLDSRGLPVTVQVIARQGADHLTIAAAAAIEDALGGWQMAEPRPLAHSQTWGRTQVDRIVDGGKPEPSP
ncbi:MAG: amidase [Oligoflexia bacterium]|nr:amidase [Oligoflexia bacterium]